MFSLIAVLFPNQIILTFNILPIYLSSNTNLRVIIFSYLHFIQLPSIYLNIDPSSASIAIILNKQCLTIIYRQPTVM